MEEGGQSGMRQAAEADAEHENYNDADSTAGDTGGGQGREASAAEGFEGMERKELRKGSWAERSWEDFKRFLGVAAGHPDGSRKGVWRQISEHHKATFLAWVKKTKFVTFYRIHFLAFFVVMMVATLILYLTPGGDGEDLQFIDAMFSVTSALCVTGLISVRMNQLSTFDKAVLMVCMVLGSQVFTSLVPVFVRQYYFRKYLEKEGIFEDESVAGLARAVSTDERMRDVANAPPLEEDEEAALQGRAGGNQDPAAIPQGGRAGEDQDPAAVPKEPQPRLAEATAGGSIERDDVALLRSHSLSQPPAASGQPSPTGSKFPPSGARVSPVDRTHAASHMDAPLTPGGGSFYRASMLSMGFMGAAAEAGDSGAERATQTWAGDTAQVNARRLKALLEATKFPQGEPGGEARTPRGALTRSVTSALAPGDWPKFDFSLLVPGERRSLELRALQLLSWLVPVYLFGIQVLCFVLILVCLLTNPFYMDLLNQNGTNAAFMASFQAVSAFANAGLSLFDNNLMSFQSYVPYLLIVACLILLGNTMYAPTLRFLLVLIARLGTQQQRLVAKYLLDHPRRCYTHLFPPSDTRWLVLTVLVFNSTEFIFFCALDWNSTALDGLTSGVKIMDGIFQSISTRNAGFNVISIGLLSAAMLVLYTGMMYIAVYPVYITRQRSREQREVYDDEDLQIFYEDLEEGVMEKGVLAQGKKMLSRDSALLFIAVFIICIIQQPEILTDSYNYSIFNIIFEAISAYGNVGLTLGYTCQPQFPNCDPVPYSFSGVWKAGSKFILILVMFLGRHRGLPDNIDAAIAIPDQKRFRRVQPLSENGEAQALTRMASAISVPPVSGHGLLLSRRTSSAVNKSPADPGVQTVSGRRFSSSSLHH